MLSGSRTPEPSGGAFYIEVYIEVAQDVLGTQRYSGSLREIAERLGVTQSGVLDHCGIKQNG